LRLPARPKATMFCNVDLGRTCLLQFWQGGLGLVVRARADVVDVDLVAGVGARCVRGVLDGDFTPTWAFAPAGIRRMREAFGLPCAVFPPRHQDPWPDPAAQGPHKPRAPRPQ